MSRPCSFPNDTPQETDKITQAPPEQQRPVSTIPVVEAVDKDISDEEPVESANEDQEGDITRKGCRSSKPAWQVQTDTVRRLDTEEREIADYDNVLWTHEPLVRSWFAPPLSYNKEQIMFVLQYFEQIAQIKGATRVQSILQARIRATSSSNLDELDPLRSFPTTRMVWEQRKGQQEPHLTKYPRGVPSYGFVLQLAPDTRRTWKATKRSCGRGKTKMVPTRAKHHEPLPIGTTVIEIILNYPNHLQYDFLDSMIQYNLGGPEIWKVLVKYPEAKVLYVDNGVTSDRQAGNFMNRRIERRMKVVIKKHGLNKAREILNSDDKIIMRDLGGELKPGSCAMCSVTHFEQKVKNAEKKAATDTDIRRSIDALAQWKKQDASRSISDSIIAQLQPYEEVSKFDDGSHQNWSHDLGRLCGKDGQLGPFRFWSCFEEFDTFMQQVQQVDECCGSFMQDLISIDTRHSHLKDRDQHTEAQRMLAAFIDHHSRLRYQAAAVLELKFSSTFSYKPLVEQLEAEVAFAFIRVTNVTEMQDLTEEAFKRIKDISTQSLLAFHGGLAQLVATELQRVVLIQPPTSTVPEDLLGLTKLPKAMDLLNRTMDALQTQSTDTATPRQKLYFKDATKNSVAQKLRDVVDATFGDESNTISWLGNILDETRQSRDFVLAVLQAEPGGENEISGRLHLLGRILNYHCEILELLDNELARQALVAQSSLIELGER